MIATRPGLRSITELGAHGAFVRVTRWIVSDGAAAGGASVPT